MEACTRRVAANRAALRRPGTGPCVPLPRCHLAQVAAHPTRTPMTTYAHSLSSPRPVSGPPNAARPTINEMSPVCPPNLGSLLEPPAKPGQSPAPAPEGGVRPPRRRPPLLLPRIRAKHAKRSTSPGSDHQHMLKTKTPPRLRRKNINGADWPSQSFSRRRPGSIVKKQSPARAANKLQQAISAIFNTHLLAKCRHQCRRLDT